MTRRSDAPAIQPVLPSGVVAGQLSLCSRERRRPSTLNEVVFGKREVTIDTALRLASLLKTAPRFWMRLQADWDLHEALERRARNTS